MRKSLIYISIFTSFLFLEACKDYLQLEPLDKVSADYLFATPAGVKTLLANLYNRMPVEDFTYRPGGGFNNRPSVAGAGDGGWSLAANSDEAIIYGANAYQSTPTSGLAEYWDYTSIRYVNQFLKNITDLKAKGSINDATYNQLFGEAHYIRADMYLTLVKRYGGVPIVNDVQVLSTDINSLLVPRSTEKETWQFIMDELDLAITNLPTAAPSDGIYRATKWVAYALKSRAALHAASIAKYWNNAPLTGPAVDAKLVGGMTAADADYFYGLCISASKAIMDNPAFELYKPAPANKEEAAKNYQDMFESASFSNKEVIFLKAYIDGSSTGQQGHITDFWFYPKQSTYETLYMSSRWGTTLNAVDVFEDYTDNSVGSSVPVKTRTDGVENYVIDPKTVSTVPYSFITYNTQYEIFANKDARLTASVLLPGSTFKGTLINMQGGLITSAGKPIIYTDNSSVGLDGKTYYTFGTLNLSGYSAFGALGTAQANYSSTGFALRKFLQESKAPSNFGTYGSSQPWIEMRLAEVYLNYAEAVVENTLGLGDAALAKTSLNAIRKRAAHTDVIPLTLANVLKERRVEMIFENTRYWDLIRRRDFHTLFNNTRRLSLIPMIDLRQNPPKYIFMRVNNYYDQANNGFTFQPKAYYMSIPGISANKLIQNPEY